MTVYHILSLWLTGMVFYVSGKHIIDLFRPARNAFSEGIFTFKNLIIVGIFIGSLGDFSDNAYWGAAWTGDGLKHVSEKINYIRDILFSNGVIANIPFRQLSDLLSNYFLALAFILLSESLAEDQRFNVISRKKYHRNLVIAGFLSALFVTYIAIVSSFYHTH